MSDNNDTTTTVMVAKGRTGFPPILIVFIVLQQLVFLFAVVGNGFVIVVFTKYLKLNSITNRFVVSLAAADFLAGVASGVQVFYFVYGALTENMVACILRFQFMAYLTTVSVVTVSFTTFDRFVAICFPHQHGNLISNKVANVLVISAWVCSSVLIIVPFSGANYWEHDKPYCKYELLYHPYVYFLGSFLNILFGMASLVMYIFILRRAWIYYKRVRPSNINGGKRIERDVRGAKVMGIVTASLTICWTPYTIYHIRYGIGITDSNVTHANVSAWLVFLGMANSIVNPFIYAWQRPDFVRASRKIFRWHNSRTQETTRVTSVTED